MSVTSAPARREEAGVGGRCVEAWLAIRTMVFKRRGLLHRPQQSFKGLCRYFCRTDDTSTDESSGKGVMAERDEFA
jgi:hypothetical protein